MMAGRGVESNDLYQLKSVVNPQFSPDGQSFVYVQTTIDQETDEYQSHIFYQKTENNRQAVQWTFGKGKNHSPCWSPDGKELAFVSNRSGKNQIHILSTSGGEARQLTFLPSGASNPVWSPDGNKLAFTTSVKPEQSIFDKKEENKQEKPVPLEVTNMRYKSDASGFWQGDFKQVVMVDVKNGELTQLTEGQHDVSLYAWSPDGKYLAVGADLAEDTDASFIYDVFLLDITKKTLAAVTDSSGFFGSATFSPDGKYLGMLGHKREFENATHTKIWVYSFQTKEMKCLTAERNLLVGDFMTGDFHQGATSPGLLWNSESCGFYFVASEKGNTNLYYCDLHGKIDPVLVGEQHVYGYSIHSESKKALAAISRPTEMGDLYLFSLTGKEGTLERRTNVNEVFLSETTLSQPESIEFEGANGWSIHGWLIKPVGFEKGKKYPLLLEIHGGPHMMYGNTYMNEFQILAAKGYAVLYVNPRGSHGYSQEFVDAVRGDYGGNDYQDLMSAVDYVLETYDFIDENRLGVTGGSYGGFMTNWIVGHTNRFKAAVTQRSISNWISFYGVSDIGYYFTEWQIDTDFRDIQKLWKHSPLAYVEKVETPLLILHSERDFRCPIEQAEQLFIALKRLGKKTKFVRFPEENHELSRSGKPSLRKSRLDYIVGWFEENL
ncbi:dipeptidyl aminopeptidase/acylaminoacyl peptidase [Bacillus sp. SLBN-46]|uniref:S9 family peptidase n=1 Tax=Bacillus sp. SLBN-46 TaxID=3042283 RepID=UPI00285D2D2A|nr:S9 family peptidase [Bacillus sp. SLBN-46]MDR6121499.1 dipeptidyl aminopeptidase/acylaminoacyl peptidase [Bacillus sp. SLBN-46]